MCFVDARKVQTVILSILNVASHSTETMVVSRRRGSPLSDPDPKDGKLLPDLSHSGRTTG